jgi:hypothetical protein
MKQANIKRIRSRFASIRFEANKFFKRIRRTLIAALSRVAKSRQEIKTLVHIAYGDKSIINWFIKFRKDNKKSQYDKTDIMIAVALPPRSTGSKTVNAAYIKRLAKSLAIFKS